MEQDLTPDQYRAKRNKLVGKWEASRITLETAKAEEMALRKEIVSFCFDPEKESGTETVPLDNGYALKSVKSINYSLDQDKVSAALDAIENIGGAEGKVIADRLVKWKADISVTEYKALPEKYAKIIDTVLTTSDGSPTLKIIAPKGSKAL